MQEHTLSEYVQIYIFYIILNKQYCFDYYYKDIYSVVLHYLQLNLELCKRARQPAFLPPVHPLSLHITKKTLKNGNIFALFKCSYLHLHILS
ncbi:hypothetical protein C0J52_12785 [Blattella germanica]|nr:hypothetical protein C0J52_12785 [Blattella germanica]